MGAPHLHRASHGAAHGASHGASQGAAHGASQGAARRVHTAGRAPTCNMKTSASAEVICANCRSAAVGIIERKMIARIRHCRRMSGTTGVHTSTLTAVVLCALLRKRPMGSTTDETKSSGSGTHHAYDCACRAGSQTLPSKSVAQSSVRLLSTSSAHAALRLPGLSWYTAPSGQPWSQCEPSAQR